MENNIETLWESSNIKRSQIIDPAKDALADDANANTIWPGYFGNNYYRSKILLLAHFPAGGTEEYSKSKYNVLDKDFYESIRLFRDSTPVSRNIAFKQMNDVSKEYIKKWSIYKLVDVVISKLNIDIEDFVYINAVPVRTPSNRHPSKAEICRAWSIYTERMLNMLNPTIIICLGIASYNAIQDKTKIKLYALRRRIGDRSLDPSVYNCIESIKYDMDSKRRLTQI